ncbi:MAG: lipopolysaccharide biosynthesis protein [Rhodoferax sp.]|nr:lipopolysaccharide biosynthesis protein [Rhodoferax sp.]MDP3651342.1 lipopolysaccharide biosynthesis protein [Rhodoferax sp.]
MSVKRRFFFSVVANIARAGASLITGLLIARGLGPSDYGNLAYLLGSFWAIRALLDMGASSAFYTFIAQERRSKIYYFLYIFWLTFQFLFSVALVAWLLPQAVVDRFWLGQERQMVLLALLATFLQNQVWQTVVQIHEAERKTIRIQMAGLLIVFVHLLLVALMLLGEWLKIQAILWAIVAEYMAGALWLSRTLRHSILVPHTDGEKTQKSTVRTAFFEYFSYCRPMIVIAVFTFCYEMADRWLLQRFGGASQQGFYQVASQLSTISLLATGSILNILWKEIAEACKRGDNTRVFALHQRATRSLVLLAAIISCFFALWAKELVAILLGTAYQAAWPILFVMLFYPIHQAMGQINGILFMASSQNATYMKVTIAGLLVSLPASYVLIAPEHGALVSGLELGAMGLAIKIVGLNIVFVNIQSWLIARHYHAKYYWYYQFSGISIFFTLAFFSKYAVQGFIPDASEMIETGAKQGLLLGVVCSGIIYLAGVLAFFLLVPKMVGFDKAETRLILKKLRLSVIGMNN